MLPPLKSCCHHASSSVAHHLRLSVLKRLVIPRRQHDADTPFGGHPRRDKSDAAGCAGDHEELIFDGL
jgi:hypothetical protein